MKEFLRVNGMNSEELETILEQCFLSSLLEELVDYIKKNNIYSSFKLRLQNCYNQKEELYILKDLIGQFSDIILLEYQVSTILSYLKAYYEKSNTRYPLSIEKKLSILNNQDNVCLICKSNIDLDNSHFDHVIAFKWVGDELESNFQALCPTCNLEKGTNSFYHLKAYLIRPKRDKLNTTSNK
ncbi:HNH endonuclease signature motif containing protein [Priestia megaterium]|uniref:HNH endonuclease n=1 Tax=Priestia megaterium TaxID=1404 RepID=UPI002D7FB279|nr:HNH endonuclease signature motif containing protein [Priestia megaterium]MEB4869037.1 HNH endonuclease signature motif containing protein [Priestia megaterium]MED4210797.1 HNH endonuclease signature motif containing protein [Priestia megaterium]